MLESLTVIILYCHAAANSAPFVGNHMPMVETRCIKQLKKCILDTAALSHASATDKCIDKYLEIDTK